MEDSSNTKWILKMVEALGYIINDDFVAKEYIPRFLCVSVSSLDIFNFCIDLFIHLVVCLTTGPKHLPKRALHVVRSRASSFK